MSRTIEMAGVSRDGAVAVRRPVSTRPSRDARVPVHRSVVAGASHDAKVAVHRFVRMCVEVLNGHRPPAHLRHLARPAEAASVVAQGLAGSRRVAELRRAALAPGRRPPKRPPPTAVIRLRLCEPRPGAVEAAVALVTGERTWAMALRMELHQETWSATLLRLI
ncbi:Rv3235 family protein [Actinoplanes sp. CA-030573]|uniref:Rv3235 family protein n=1 Tax=Actinoplanes sp. CA-030573 TaxID=3239898 RepID=UPI003D8CF6BC